MNAPADIQEKVIEPRRSAIDFRELSAYRELFYYFVWREFQVRYKQTALGVLWALLQPLTTMIVFTALFHHAAGIPSENMPYPLFSYTGLLLWGCFASAVTRSSNALVDHRDVISKVYFPRIIPPLSAIFVAFIDFAIAALVLIGMTLYYHITPSITGLILLIPLILTMLLAAAGLGLFLTALNVRYRDVKIVLPFFLQICFFLTPVIYPISIVSKRFRWLLYFNPMTGVISGLRSWLFGSGSENLGLMAISIGSALAAIAIGLSFFQVEERTFGDLL